MYVKVPEVDAVWEFDHDPNFQIEEIMHRKWCIGFGHVDGTHPNVAQWLCLHADYLQLTYVRLLVRDGTKSYVISFCLLCNQYITHYLMFYPVPRLRWKIVVKEKDGEGETEKIIYDTGCTDNDKNIQAPPNHSILSQGLLYSTMLQCNL